MSDSASSDAAPAVAEALAAAGTSLMPAAGSSEKALQQEYTGTIPMLPVSYTHLTLPTKRIV